MTIGQNIHRLRREKGVSQWQLAKETGITTGALYLIERGLRECTPDTLTAIANALGVTEAKLRGKR